MIESGEIRLWEAMTRKALRVFDGHEDFAGALCFIPDSRYLVSGGGDDIACLWILKPSVESAREQKTPDQPAKEVADFQGKMVGTWIVGL